MAKEIPLLTPMFVRSGQSAVLARKEGRKEGCIHSAHCAGSQLDDDGEKKHIASAVQLEKVCTLSAIDVLLVS